MLLQRGQFNALTRIAEALTHTPTDRCLLYRSMVSFHSLKLSTLAFFNSSGSHCPIDKTAARRTCQRPLSLMSMVLLCMLENVTSTEVFSLQQQVLREEDYKFTRSLQLDNC